jgi:hypothetical protein
MDLELSGIRFQPKEIRVKVSHGGGNGMIPMPSPLTMLWPGQEVRGLLTLTAPTPNRVLVGIGRLSLQRERTAQTGLPALLEPMELMGLMEPLVQLVRCFLGPQMQSPQQASQMTLK